MTHVRLVGPANDGHDLLVSTDGGDEFMLPVTEELKRAVARAEGGAEGDAAALSPREIQRRIRAGFTAEELADLAGVPLASIERYEGPILAERAYITELARATRVGRETGAPTLGEVVTDRLAARGIPAKALTWDAFRVSPEPWRVVARFLDGARTVEAVWTYHHAARSIVADDERSRWLTETELMDLAAPPRQFARLQPSSALEDLPESPRAGGHLRAVGAPPRPEPAPPSTEDLLADLQAKRGTREVVDLDEDDEVFEGFGPLNARQAEFSVASGGEGLSAEGSAASDSGDAAAPGSHSAGARAAGSYAGTSPAGAPRASGARSKRNGRAHVPSWDEIVFGAKGD
jgi:hypothetical protein